MPPNPNPVPTPWQSPTQGGNPVLKPGTIGPSVGGTTPVTSNINGTATFANGAQYPSSSTNLTQSFNNTNTATGTYNPGPVDNYVTQQSQPFNPYTSYVTINGETKKGADWISEGKLDQKGNVIGPSAPPSQWTSPDGSKWNSEADYMREIDNAFNSSMGYLNQNQSLLGTSRDAALSAADADFAANQGLLNSQKTSSLETIGQQETAGKGRKEDAFAAARRLYQELQMANRQRFGGASSAGQAASEIQGAEAQRNFGQTTRDYNQFMQNIEGAKRSVEEQFNQGVLQLQSSKQQAVAKIQSDFTNAIMQINNLRAQTEQQKGAARLQALQNLRSQAMQIDQQANQFQQQLELMREQQRLNIEAYTKTGQGAASGAQNAFGTFQNNTTLQPSTKYNLGGTDFTTNAQPTYVGSIKKNVVGQDALGRTVYQDPTGVISQGWTKYDSFGNPIR